MGACLGSAVWGIYSVDLLERMATSQPAHYTSPLLLPSILSSYSSVHPYRITSLPLMFQRQERTSVICEHKLDAVTHTQSKLWKY